MAFLRNLLSRRKRRARDTAEDWHAGDVAECVVPGPWFGLFGDPRPGPELNEQRLVKAVIRDRHPATGKAHTWLIFSRWDPKSYDASGFRKVTPRADALERGELVFEGLDQRKPVSIPDRETEDA